MNKAPVVALVVALLAAGRLPAIEYSDLSESAKAVVPDEATVQVVAGDGMRFEGAVVSDTGDTLTIKVKRSGTMSMSKSFQKSQVRSIRRVPVDEVFGRRLLEIVVDERQSLPVEEGRRLAALYAEFLEKCKGAPQYAEIRERFLKVGDQVRKVNLGMELVEGEWLAPVQAAVKKFRLFGDQMGELKRRPDFSGNPKVGEAYAQLLESRREAARGLPALMQNRIPTLLEEKRFQEAVEETVAFLQFWIAEVIRTEGSVADVIRQMDFDYILRMQKRIMEKYREAGEGNARPGGVSVPADMVYIPGGYFIMGQAGQDPRRDDFPMRIVFVSPFLLDKYEVTNADYRKFVDHVKSTGDYSMAHPEAPPLKKHEADGWNDPALSRDRQPVVGVDWYDAYAYANWVKKRLPTEAEWEKAARGMDGRTYTWGEDLSACAVNWNGGRAEIAAEMDRQNPPKPPEAAGCGCVKKEEPPPPPTTLPTETWDVDKTLPPRALKAIENEAFEWTKKYETANGLFHMAGNAAEWVSDLYDSQYYALAPVNDPQGPEKQDAKIRNVKSHVFRGGSYVSGSSGDLATYWRGVPRDPGAEAGDDGSGRGMIGIRCARSLSVVKEQKKFGSEIDFDALMRDLKAADEAAKAAGGARRKPGKL